MQKKLVSIFCMLALLAFLMPATAAEGNLNDTVNSMLNDTANATASIALNETRNANASIVINETENATASAMLNATSDLAEEKLAQAETPDATMASPAADIPESTAAATQLGTGSTAAHSKVLRAGFEKTKPVNNLDVYGNKSTYNIPFSALPSAAFNVSQRLGNVSQFTYNTDIYKPVYNISQYSRIKPLYQVPSTLSSKPVYSISSYPVIKTVNSIP